jgi:indolepyruvate ferredoxin oxidoreductase
MTVDTPTRFADIRLDDKYRRDRGRIYLTGVQALVRLPLVQHRRDRVAGFDTAGFISGYRGSPLGTYDRELWAAKQLLAEERVRFEPGLNEELAATSVWGSQQVGLFPGARQAGVFGLWYAKSPGVDRSGDALKHANMAGTAPLGGVLAVAGDDHACKSASLPSQSDFAFRDASIPVLHPATVAEVIRFGLIGWEMSRRAGLWVGIKALADTMDSAASIDIGEVESPLILPQEPPADVSIRWPDPPLEQERRLFEVRLPAAVEFGRINGVNRLLTDTPDKRLVIIAVGKSLLDVQQALRRLKLEAAELPSLGIALATVGMPWPLDPRFAEEVTRGAVEVLVIEEKRALVEEQLARIVFNNRSSRPQRLLGKQDDRGFPLLCEAGTFDPRRLALVIGRRLIATGVGDRVRSRVEDLEAELAVAGASPLGKRLPYFCAGCPHNRSTRVPESSRALAGIGCHYMAQWMDRATTTFSQMGGEGAAWIGQSGFTETGHVFANLGDGTYVHSGSLAIRAAKAAGVNITYKLLYNDAVAMTGGQPAEGNLSVAQIAAQLRGEGVENIRIVAENPDRFAQETLPSGVSVHPRERLEQVQRSLREVKGVSVLIFDQVCAAEKRRRRKRGTMAQAARRTVINEAVCEGCGDCGVQSNCVAIVPVETVFGRKRRIDQTSCNQDLTCVEGFCPSFVSIDGGRVRKPDAHAAVPPEVPQPVRQVGDSTALVIGGIGGTGIVTIGAVLGMAAHLDDKGVTVLDQIGLAQKGGEVTTHVRIVAAGHPQGPVRLSRGEAATLIGCDLVVAANHDVLDLLAPDSVAIVNTHETMTADFTRAPDLAFAADAMQAQISDHTKAVRRIDLTGWATRLLGDSVGANVMALGMAWQLGRIPITREALLRAMELNGVAVAMNKAAFAWGRALAHDPEGALRAHPQRTQRSSWSLDEVVGESERHLIQYQNRALAARYTALVTKARTIESSRIPGSTALALAVARSYHKLLTYKDEYEVARLLADPEFLAALKQQFEGGRMRFHLSPPLFARLDPATRRPRKIQLGFWMLPLFRMLAMLKGLRDTRLDVFGYSQERRRERQRIRDFELLCERLLAQLTTENHSLAIELAELPLSIRGFGPVQTASADHAAERLSGLLAEWPNPGAIERAERVADAEA